MIFFRLSREVNDKRRITCIHEHLWYYPRRPPYNYHQKSTFLNEFETNSAFINHTRKNDPADSEIDTESVDFQHAIWSMSSRPSPLLYYIWWKNQPHRFWKWQQECRFSKCHLFNQWMRDQLCSDTPSENDNESIDVVNVRLFNDFEAISAFIKHIPKRLTVDTRPRDTVVLSL